MSSPHPPGVSRLPVDRPPCRGSGTPARVCPSLSRRPSAAPPALQERYSSHRVESVPLGSAGCPSPATRPGRALRRRPAACRRPPGAAQASSPGMRWSAARSLEPGVPAGTISHGRRPAACGLQSWSASAAPAQQGVSLHLRRPEDACPTVLCKIAFEIPIHVVNGEAPGCTGSRHASMRRP